MNDRLMASIHETLTDQRIPQPYVVAQAVRDNLVIEITDEMIELADEAEENAPGLAHDQTRAALAAAFKSAGFTVAAH
jgi:hypothetical protein